MHGEVISNAKSRVLKLLDEGSFIEFDELQDVGVIIGYGTVLARPVCVISQNSDVMSGAVTKKGLEKISKAIDMAVKNGIPLITFFDSIGAKIDEGTIVLAGLGKVFSKIANASGVIPLIGVISGSVTGVMNFWVSLCDFTFMIDKTSSMFINSPQVLLADSGIDISGEEIGGASTHFNKTGSCSFLCNNEDKCVSELKKLLEYLPDNNLADTSVIDIDDLNRECPELLSEGICANDVINSISDNECFLEISAGFATNMIIGFSRIGGRVVGIVSNNGKIDGNGILKASRFVSFCDSFNIPIVTLIDSDGFLVSLKEEQDGLIRKCGKLLFSYADATVTKINVIFGKAYGGANLMMGTNPDMTLAFNNSKISVVEPKVAVNILYSEEILNSESPVSFREEKLNEYLEENVKAMHAEEDGFVDAVINPLSLRKRIISSLDLFSGKREIKSIRRHGCV